MGVERLFIVGLVFFVALLFVFLRFFGFLLTFILLAFVSHSFLLRSSRVLTQGQFLFFNGLGSFPETFNFLK